MPEDSAIGLSAKAGSPTCPVCGAELPLDAVHCTRCLIELALAATPPPAAEISSETRSLLSKPAPKPGERIGRYKLLQQIGEGGCGVVYMAAQEEDLRRRVALKVIKLGMDTKQVIARFEAERQALALMDHPNIASVLDAGTTESGRPFFVMELVKGIPVTRYCDENQLDTRQRLEIFIKVCQAVQHAHQKGIIHRDLKPSNVLVAEHDGTPVPKVIDFGIAKATGDHPIMDKTVLTAFAQFIGTPAYMSPEQAKLGGLDIDTRTDIYSLGVLLYELLTGKTPFDAARLVRAGLEEIQRIIREEEPPRPSTRLSTLTAAERTSMAARRQAEPPRLVGLLRGDLDWIVMKALEKDRNRRYDSANAFAQDLARFLEDEPVLASPPSQFYRLQKFVRRNRLSVASASAVACATFIGLGFSTWSFLNEKAARQRADAEAIRADQNAAGVNQALAASLFLQAARLISEHDALQALPYLQRSLALNPTNDAALTRVATLLAYHTWMVPRLNLNHGNQVLSAQWSPDGKRIVTASSGGTARVWDAQDGKPLSQPLKHDSAVFSARFSPDGLRIVTTSDSAAQVWNTETGQPLAGPLRHAERVHWAEFSPDSKRIVTASGDTSARVWDADTGQLLIALGNNGEVNSAVWSSDGKRIVTASSDGTVGVWNAQTGLPLAALPRLSEPIDGAQFSPDGKWVVSVSGSAAQMWNAETGQPLFGLRHADRVRCAEFSPDGKWIVTASWDNTAQVWESQTGLRSTSPLKHGQPVLSARFSPDGTRLLTVSLDHRIRVWDTQSGQALTEQFGHRDFVESAEFSPDGGSILTASRDGTARVWEAAGGPARPEFLKHEGAVYWAQFSPDGMFVVTASFDKTARIWDARSGRAVTGPLRHNRPVTDARFSPDGTHVVTASEDSTARVWEASSGRPVTGPLKHKSRVHSAQFSPDGMRVVTGSADFTACVWNARSGELLSNPLKHHGLVISAQFSRDAERLVTASYDGTARVWDAGTWLPLTEPLQNSGSYVGMLNSVEFSPDGTKLVTASGDNTAQVWNISGKALLGPLRHGHWVLSARFSPDATRILTASSDRTARLWDASTGHAVAEPLKHDGAVRSAVWSSNGQRILTASSDETARVWDPQSGQPLSDPLKHRGAVGTAEFNRDGNRVVAACTDGTAAVWDIAPSSKSAPAWLPRLLEAISGQVLSSGGVLEPITNDTAKVLADLRLELSLAPDNEGWVAWGRWFLSDPDTRTISPLSKMTIFEYTQNRIEHDTAESLSEAQELAGDKPQLLERLHITREALGIRIQALQKVAELRSNFLAFTEEARLSEADERRRKLSEAENLFLKDLPDLRTALPGDPWLADALAWFARNQLEREKFTDAEPLTRQCLAIRQERLGKRWATCDAQSLLGRSLLGQKRFAEAEPLLVAAYQGFSEQATTLPPVAEPLREEALRGLTNLLVTTGRLAEASALGHQRFDEILASYGHNLAEDLDPSQQPDPFTLNFLAWQWATCESKVARDGKQAIACATNAVELTGWTNFDYVDTLAAAYAADGQFKMAIPLQKKVIESSRAGAWKDDFIARLRQYEAGKLYRDVQ